MPRLCLRRVLEWFVLKGVLRFIFSCHGQGRLPLDRIAPSLVQPGVDTSRDGAATASLGNPFHHPHREEVVWKPSKEMEYGGSSIPRYRT